MARLSVVVVGCRRVWFAMTEGRLGFGKVQAGGFVLRQAVCGMVCAALPDAESLALVLSLRWVEGPVRGEIPPCVGPAIVWVWLVRRGQGWTQGLLMNGTESIGCMQVSLEGGLTLPDFLRHAAAYVRARTGPSFNPFRRLRNSCSGCGGMPPALFYFRRAPKAWSAAEQSISDPTWSIWPAPAKS